MKKKIDKGKSKPLNCREAHWDQMIEVLKQEENVDRVARMMEIQAT